MNRKKINSIIAVMSTVLTVNLGGTVNVHALEADNDVPSLQEHQKSNYKEQSTDTLESTGDSESSEDESDESEESVDTNTEAESNEESRIVNSDNTGVSIK